MDQPVTPYIWKYQPETGTAAGARQNYGAVINWLGADPKLYARIQEVNRQRNDLDIFRAAINRHEIASNFNNWPAYQIYQPAGTVYTPPSRLHISSVADAVATADGAQLSGGISTPISGGGYSLGDGRQYRKLTRDLLPFPTNWQVFEDGEWKNISGGSANATSSYPQMIYENQPTIVKYYRPGQQLQGYFPTTPSTHLLTEESRVPRSGGLDPVQFIREFSPVVYKNPFSKPLQYFPKEFNPLFKNSFIRTNDYTLQYK
ncbi:MAG: pVIII protein [Agile wallaby adenovirus 1]|nr:MAG: pVIII protein [Agile wallaby atadenovirus 1]